MPPLPWSSSSSTSTPNPPNDDIAAALRSLNLRHAHLSTSSIPALAQSVSSLKDQQVLASQVREDLDDYGRAVENLEALVEDLEREREKAAWRVVVLDWADKYASLKAVARTALLTSKRKIDTNTKSRRDELLAGGILNPRGDDEKIGDTLMRTTHTLTTALQRTEQRLRSELERSVLSTQLLQSSTSTLRQTSNAHSNLTSLLDTSRGLITALERTDWFDRFLIFLALAVFLGTCAWIVKVRVVDRALWLGFWWVKYLPFPGQGGNADVVVRVKVEASADIAEVVVATTLASVMAEVTNSTVLAEAVGALASTGTSATTDALGGNGTDAKTTNQAVSVTSPAHRGEL